MIHLDNKTFSVERTQLVMNATPRTEGSAGLGPRVAYRHACTFETLQLVAHTIDEAGADGIDRRRLVEATGRRHTQVSVAMAFLVERGIVQESGPRGSILSSKGATHIDVMTEYHALREKPAEAAQSNAAEER